MENGTDNTTRNLLLALIVLLVVVPACCAAVLGGFWMLGMGAFLASEGGEGTTFVEDVLEDFDLDEAGRVEVSRSYDESFTVRGPVQLSADLQVGSLKVTVGESDAVGIEGEITGYGRNAERAEAAADRVELDAEQSGREITITGRWDDPPSGWQGQSPKIDLQVTVPERTALTIRMDVGEVTVDGTNGDVDIILDVGEVRLRDVRVPDRLVVETDVAPVEFEGALVRGSLYELSSDVGQVTMTLPEDSEFAIEATSDVGDVSVEFDVDGVSERDLMSKRVEGVVGEDDDTRLVLRSDVGRVSVRKQ